jgi:hypothetical protein
MKPEDSKTLSWISAIKPWLQQEYLILRIKIANNTHFLDPENEGSTLPWMVGNYLRIDTA